MEARGTWRGPRAAAQDPLGARRCIGGGGGGGGSTFVGTLRPGTPGPGGHPTMHYFNPSFRNSATPPRKTASLLAEREGNGVPTQKRASFEKIVMGLMELHATNVENSL
ncbi:UNVERIFIED_CONTAM: hypothetical protein Sradi_6987700 [Sesamum radiatum]|uniref:Uncharacterized protein n=1 Tax=Sesamum radiatum TaxID=300843 RepID=A0AAW2JDL4_SESRA